MGPEEGLIYRIPELARQVLVGTAFDDPYICQHRNAVRLNSGWQEQVRSVLKLKWARRSEVARTLLVVSLFTRNEEPAHLASEILSECEEGERGVPGSDFLWVGRAVAPTLLTRTRIAAVGRAGEGLDILAALGEWEAVELHLRAHAARVSESAREDPMLQWYRGVEKCGPDEQHRCLRIYLELAPSFLAERGRPPSPVGDLVPVREVSRGLKFARYELPKPLGAAVQGDRKDLARLWMRAVLFEAANGPNRQADLECLETVFACAGAWLVVENDAERRLEWLDFAVGLSDEMRTRSLWSALFRGAALVSGEKLLDEVRRWPVPSDIRARLALAEVFAEHGQLHDVRAFWEEFIRGDRHSWLICLRACDSVRWRRSNRPEFEALARVFTAQAWETAQGTEAETDPEFLADVVERAVETRSESTLASVWAAASADATRACALGRIALDVFLRAVQSKSETGSSWDLADLEGAALAPFVAALVKEAATEAKPGDLSPYNHSWSESNRGMKSGLGWLAAILKAILAADPATGSLRWVGTWITGIPAARDADGGVAKVVLEWANKAAPIPPEAVPILDFALESLLAHRWSLSDRLELVRGLLEARHRVADCLQMLDGHLSTADADRHWGLIKAAVVCGETLQDTAAAERYLRQLPSEGRALAEDRIGEKRGETTATRIKRLLSVPQTSEVVKRLLRVTTDALSRLKDVTDDDLQAICAVAVRLLADSPTLDDRLASALGEVLPAAAIPQLRRRATLLSSISH